tara:strand:+ start:78 stop:1295 length:1218 start_codon:yes stop_codon:yes gene_type:complete
MSGGGLFFVLQRNNLSYTLFFLAIFVLVFMGKKIKKSIFYASLFTLSLFLSLILVNYITAPQIEIMRGEQLNYLQYAFHFLNITSCILILVHLKNNREASYFLDRIHFILKIVLYHALLSFLCYFFLKGYLIKLHGGWGNEYVADSFYYLFFYDVEKYNFSLFGIEFIRNQGWFWEPGILQIFLNILLFIEGFVVKKNKWTIFLLIITIITTYSTTGILIMLILLILISWSYIRRNPLVIIFAIGLLLPLFYVAETNIENKTTGERSSSFQKRYLDLVQPFAIAIDYPITGVGLDRDFFQKFRSRFQMEDDFGKILETSTGLERIAQSTEKGSSNSLTYLIAAMGFPSAFFLFYCLLKQNLFTKRKGIFMTIIIISLFSEPLLLRPFFLILVVSGMFSFFNKFTQ